MLVLTRAVGEAVQINNDILVRVLSINDRGQIRLSFEAPKETKIFRTELLTRARAAAAQ